MRRWLFTLGGLIVWLAHFLGVYVVASVADTVATADAFPWRMGSLVFSALCVVVVLGLLVLAIRRLARIDREPGPVFMSELAVLASGLALVAILWQSAPNLIGH